MIVVNGLITIFREVIKTDPKYGTRSKAKSKEALYSGDVQWRYLSEDRHTPTPPTTRETASIEAIIPLTQSLPPTEPLKIEIKTTGEDLITATARTIEHLQLVRKTRVIATLSSTEANNDSNPKVYPNRDRSSR